VRRLIRRASVAAAAVTLACASVEAPPGGPPDSTAPVLLDVTPDTGAVGVHPDEVIFRFNEVIRERPARGASLRALFIISPTNGDVETEWKRSGVGVRPGRGWRDSTTYTITVLPGIADLRGNVRDAGNTLVFSTGPSIARSRVRGLVFDWVGGRIAANAWVEALSRPDSVVHVAATDSTGAFVLANMPPGTYRIRAIIDANANRALDPREMWDSTVVTLADSATVELLAFVHDSTPPRIASVQARDTFTVRVSLDRPLHPDLPLDSSRFILRASDSSVVPILEVRPTAVWEREQAARAGAPPPETPPPAPPGRGRAGAPIVPAIVPSRPSPLADVVIILGTPLRPGGEYRLIIRNARGLEGPAETSARVFNVAPRPAPPPPPDPLGGRSGRRR
jgi:hypothetical protein